MNANRTLYGNLIIFVLLWVLCVLAASSKHFYIATAAMAGMLTLIAYTYWTERGKWINSQTPINLESEAEMHSEHGFFHADVKVERRNVIW